MSKRSQFAISNGKIGIELESDGRGYSHISNTARPGSAIDLTRRPTDSLESRGTFFYIRDKDSGILFSAGFEPTRVASPDYAVTEAQPGVLEMINQVDAIRAEMRIWLAEDQSVEFRTLRLSNLADRPRRFALTSFQELALKDFPSYIRDSDFNALHIATWFVPPLNAIFARNRLLRDGAGDFVDRRNSREIFFHSVRLPAGARLEGYEDSRIRFLGSGTYRIPQGIEESRPRSPQDSGLLYTFDPVASLTIGVDLPALSACEILFINGHASDEFAAARLIVEFLDIAPLETETLTEILCRVRELKTPDFADWPFAFSRSANELTLTEKTPRPWAHVLANRHDYGALVSNDGQVHSFAGNERGNALTPFRFEQVATSLPGQVIYVVDLENGEIHAPGFVPLRRKDTRYEVVYEKGVACFRSFGPDVDLDMTIFVPPDAPACVRLLVLRNKVQRKRRFRIVGYFDLVLAETALDSLGKIETKRVGDTALFTNPTNRFHQGWGFSASNLDIENVETVRARFFGSAGQDLTRPVMVTTGASDPQAADDGRRVAAFSGIVSIEAGAEVEVAIVLGQADSEAQAGGLAEALRHPTRARKALAATRDHWSAQGSTIEIETNNPEFDRLVNHWLHYQILAARLFARCGSNQRSGAYGFRDQLQDVLPLFFSDAALARRQILRHASQQFLEGDVLKWWHPTQDGGTGLGQRSRASDPHLWLPYVVARYVAATGDHALLEEKTPYLSGPLVPMDRDSLMFAPEVARAGDVYEHCRLAIDCTLARFGAHGLPLLGTGDWNDALDVAGFAERGESIWMGFFLHDILQEFSPLIASREGAAKANAYLAKADEIKAALESAWRTDHYIFVFTDSGAVLEHTSALTAAWSVLSGAVDFARGRLVLESALARLEKSDRVLLLDPPFDQDSVPFPGRIASYPPGVRENGGQYSHGSSWTIDAMLRLAEISRGGGDMKLAAHFKARAFTLWKKISPLGKTTGEALAIYGLAPHQQPADIYDGLGHGGRGGWSWYTGSAARMLSAAYAILGLRMDAGEILVPDDIFEPKGELTVKKIRARNKVLVAPAAQRAPK
jgi:cyclic beta-1,2-glucan synthetase